MTNGDSPRHNALVLVGGLALAVVLIAYVAAVQHRYEHELLEYMARIERHTKPSSVAHTSSYWARLEALSTHGTRTSSYHDGFTDGQRR